MVGLLSPIPRPDYRSASESGGGTRLCRWWGQRPAHHFSLNIKRMSTTAPASFTPLLDTDRPTSLPDPKLDYFSFDDVYRLYSKRVYWLCLRMVWNPAEAEDWTQEVFVRVFQKMHQFQGRAALSTWLHRVAPNAVLMQLRKRSHPTASRDEVLSP